MINTDGYVLIVEMNSQGHLDAYVFERKCERIVSSFAANLGTDPHIPQLLAVLRPDLPIAEPDLGKPLFLQEYPHRDI